MSADLLGFESVPAPRTNERHEAAALVEVLHTLRGNHSVAWVERQNTGAAKVGERFIHFGWRGCSDLIGMLKDGRLLAVEVKAPGGDCDRNNPSFSLWCAGLAGWHLWPEIAGT